jgi:hypothetical protein
VLGYRRQEASQIRDLSRPLLTISDVQEMDNLGLIDGNTAKNIIRAHGFDDEETITSLKAMSQETPSLDAVLRQGRIIAGGTPLTRFLADGNAIPDWYKDWSSRLGFDHTIDNTQKYGTEDWQNSWGKLAWTNSWQLPDISLLAQFLHRFRGDPGNPSTWTVPGVQPLTLDEANALLTANGVSDAMKPYIYNLMYSPLNLRHIQLIVRYMPVGVDQVALWLQDNGISPQQSQILATTYIAKRQEEIQKPILVQRQQALRKLQQSIEAAYETGTIDNETALSELVANGLDEAAAVASLSAVDIHVANTLTNEVIKRARSDVFAGIVQVSAIGPRLIQSGIAAPRVTQLIATWVAQLSMGRKTLGTDKILRYLRKGFITRDAAMVRLTNLGWQGVDLLLLLSDVQSQIATDAAKTIAAADKEKAHEERAIETQINRMGTLFDSLVSRLKVLTPVAKILKWYKAGLWSEDRARKRLRKLLYTDDVIDTMLLDALGTGTKPAAKTGGGT